MGATQHVADVQSGELIRVHDSKRTHYAFPRDSEGKRHMAVGAAASELVETMDYSGTTFRVLLHLIRTTDSSGVVHKTNKEIAESIRVSEPSVSRAMRQLNTGGQVYRKGKSTILNALVGFTGSGEQHQGAVGQMPENLRPLAEVRHLQPVS